MPAIWREAMEEIPEGEIISRKHKLFLHLYTLSLLRQPVAVAAARLLLEYTVGKPIQQLDLRPLTNPETAAFHRLLQRHPRLATEYQRVLEEELEDNG